MGECELGEFRSAVRASLRPVSGGACGDTRAVWRALGQRALIGSLYHDDVRRKLRSERLGVLLEELDRQLPVGVVLSVCVQVATVIPLLATMARAGTLAADAAGAALRGEAIVALAVTDSAVSGSSLLDAQTRVRVAADAVVVDGGKDWITNARQCDYALSLCRHAESRHFTSFRWVLIPAAAPGVSVINVGDALFPGAGLGNVRFDRVALTPGHLVGLPGRALTAFSRQIGAERWAGALWARAVCRRVLASTREWLMHRPSNCGTLWDNAAIRERFARCLVELARLDALCAHRGATRDEDSPVADIVLKAAVGDAVDRILGECADLHGAESFRDGGEAILRAAAGMFGVAGGATGAMLAAIADHADAILLEGARGICDITATRSN
jgi:acyl-CoA dehydrogenase